MRYGASPRAAQALVLAAKIHALNSGHAFVSVEDIRTVAMPALRHRLLLNFEGEADEVSTDTIVNELLARSLPGEHVKSQDPDPKLQGTPNSNSQRNAHWQPDSESTGLEFVWELKVRVPSPLDLDLCISRRHLTCRSDSKTTSSRSSSTCTWSRSARLRGRTAPIG